MYHNITKYMLFPQKQVYVYFFTIYEVIEMQRKEMNLLNGIIVFLRTNYSSPILTCERTS